MDSTRRIRVFAITALAALFALTLYVSGIATAQEMGGQMMGHTSKPFTGPKANKGTVTHTKVNGKNVLTLSDDFVVPDTPDPHWQVVDSQGRVYDLAKLKVKNDGYNKSITLLAYVPNVSKIIIWCAWAETNLGEASFDKPVM